MEDVGNRVLEVWFNRKLGSRMQVLDLLFEPRCVADFDIGSDERRISRCLVMDLLVAHRLLNRP
jgi:hypothetical protein